MEVGGCKLRRRGEKGKEVRFLECLDMASASLILPEYTVVHISGFPYAEQRNAHIFFLKKYLYSGTDFNWDFVVSEEGKYSG